MEQNTSRRVDTEFDLSTQQGIFDHVATALLKQGSPAMNATGQCRYYVAETGCRCAAGHLLVGDPGYLGKLLGSVYNDEVWASFDDRITATDKPVFDLLRNLQVAHDRAAGHALISGFTGTVDDREFVANFKAEMNTLADELGLDPRLVLA